MSRSEGMRIITVRIEAELAERLNTLPNKSEFIRAAILARCAAGCPLCAGRGVVPRGIGETLAPILWANRTVACAGCGDRESIPVDLDVVPDADRVRWERFLRGGGYVCARCRVDAQDSTTV